MRKQKPHIHEFAKTLDLTTKSLDLIKKSIELIIQKDQHTKKDQHAFTKNDQDTKKNHRIFTKTDHDTDVHKGISVLTKAPQDTTICFRNCAQDIPKQLIIFF